MPNDSTQSRIRNKKTDYPKLIVIVFLSNIKYKTFEE